MHIREKQLHIGSYLYIIVGCIFIIIIAFMNIHNYHKS